MVSFMRAEFDALKEIIDDIAMRDIDRRRLRKALQSFVDAAFGKEIKQKNGHKTS